MRHSWSPVADEICPRDAGREGRDGNGTDGPVQRESAHSLLVEARCFDRSSSSSLLMDKTMQDMDMDKTTAATRKVHPDTSAAAPASLYSRVSRDN